MYYPKSQIVTNLYTNGQEFVIKSTNQNYIGFYWKTSDGKFFTGKTPDDINIQSLIPATDSISQQYSNLTSAVFTSVSGEYITSNYGSIEEYNKLKQNLIEIKNIPSSYNPKPTEDDYQLGEFARYFCKKTNEIRYLEINKDTYEKLLGQDPTYLWQLYTPFKYQWILVGEEKYVYSTNKKVTEYMISKFNLPSLNKFLKEDYLKFWRPN